MNKLKWWWVKKFNMLNYFRDHVADYDKTFWIAHPAHFNDHEGYREKVRFVSYDEKKKEYMVKRTDHKEGQKPFISAIKKSQIFLHSK